VTDVVVVVVFDNDDDNDDDDDDSSVSEDSRCLGWYAVSNGKWFLEFE
jgi:hypothetical protein